MVLRQIQKLILSYCLSSAITIFRWIGMQNRKVIYTFGEMDKWKGYHFQYRRRHISSSDIFDIS